MKLSTMQDWLGWISTLNPKQVDLGLERVKTLVARLNILPRCQVITVGGTNGKGSTVGALEAIYLAGGYKVGAFTSPVLFTHNEQVRLNGVMATDEQFCTAFEKVAAVIEDLPLTSFEFHTVAAFLILQAHDLDVWLLEVGLGGRLDAVNVIDADLSIVTSISIDHTEYLGNTRESIGFEKAGIFRANRPAVCGDPLPPASLLAYAKEIGAELYIQAKDFSYVEHEQSWDWVGRGINYKNLPKSSLALQNMSGVLMAVELLGQALPISQPVIQKALTQVQVPGRIQMITRDGQAMEIYDVSHNEASINLLAKKLSTLRINGKVHAVFSMLADKDIDACLAVIASQIDTWHVAQLQTPRAMTLEKILAAFRSLKIHEVSHYSAINVALAQVRKLAAPEDCILIFGSFHTVAETLGDVSLRSARDQ